MRGYHIYKDIWDAIIGEELQCEREPDKTEVIGMRSPLGLITGHLPREYHEPVLRTENEVTCLVIVCAWLH